MLEKKCSTQVSLQTYYLKYAIMWNKETTHCSCSSFLLSFKILCPEIQSNIICKRPGLCTSVNNFIYLFLWSWAGGIQRILQCYWVRQAGSIFLSPDHGQSEVANWKSEVSKHWQKQKTNDDKNITFPVLLNSFSYLVKIEFRNKWKSYSPAWVGFGKNCTLCLRYSFSQYGPPS